MAGLFFHFIYVFSIPALLTHTFDPDNRGRKQSPLQTLPNLFFQNYLSPSKCAPAVGHHGVEGILPALCVLLEQPRHRLELRVGGGPQEHEDDGLRRGDVRARLLHALCFFFGFVGSLWRVCWSDTSGSSTVQRNTSPCAIRPTWNQDIHG